MQIQDRGVNDTRTFNYLLVMPRMVQNTEESYIFPLGIAYVSSSLKKAGFNVCTLNLNHYAGTLYDIIKTTVERDRINVVMTGGLSAQYGIIRPIIEAAKQIDSSLITVVGGGIITSDPIVAMDALEYVDFGVIGEGEVTSVELCRLLESGGDFAACDGLIFKVSDQRNRLLAEAGNRYTITNQRMEIADIDAISWPDYDGFEFKNTLTTPLGYFSYNGLHTFSMITSRSCPYSCTFCFHTVGKKYRQRSLDGFFKELDHVVSNYNVRGLYISDELFARNISRLKEFCARIKPYDLKWVGSFRVDDVTREMLTVLKDGGCVSMAFGLESADNHILKSMRKGITVEQIENTLKLGNDAGMSMSGSFIFGDIEETLESASNTLTWWKDHSSKYGINLRLIIPYPGTYIYKYACENGRIADPIQYLKDGCPQINVSKMSNEEFQLFTKQMMEAVLSHTKQLVVYELSNIDNEIGCVDINGECDTCGEINRWTKIRLFKHNCVACKNCGQQYYPPLNRTIRLNLDTNISSLLQEYSKLAVWGMTNHAIDIFSNSTVLHSKSIFPIDSSSSKQNSDVFGKQIYSPDIIAEEEIRTVIVTAPISFGYIAAQIETNYKCVEQIIDISNLIGTDVNR